MKCSTVKKSIFSFAPKNDEGRNKKEFSGNIDSWKLFYNFLFCLGVFPMCPSCGESANFSSLRNWQKVIMTLSRFKRYDFIALYCPELFISLCSMQYYLVSSITIFLSSSKEVFQT